MLTTVLCRYARGSLQLLDQLKLPFEFEYIQISDCKQTWTAIKDMNVRCMPKLPWARRGCVVAILSTRAYHLVIGTRGTPMSDASHIPTLHARLFFTVASWPTVIVAKSFRACRNFLAMST